MELTGYDAWKLATPPEYADEIGELPEVEALSERAAAARQLADRLNTLLGDEPAVTVRFAKLARVERLAGLRAREAERALERAIDHAADAAGDW